MPQLPVIESRRHGDRVADRPAIEVSFDVVGFGDAEHRTLKTVLTELGERLGVRLSFGGAASDVLVLEATHAMSLSSTARHTLQAGRPLMLLLGAELRGGLRRAHDGRDLLNQLRRLPQLRTLAD